MHNFSPFSVKIYTYIRFWWWQGGNAKGAFPNSSAKGALPNFLRQGGAAPFPKEILYLMG